ncbi:MAG: DUF692 domain-containing protein [Pseudomonadota bacterium]
MTTTFPPGERGLVSGVGIGLRDPHYKQLLAGQHGVPWLELLADNFLAPGGMTRVQLNKIAETYPLTLHCVGMNLGGVDPLNFDYLGSIRELAEHVGPAWISDHLCFTQYQGHHYHDLLPLPYTEEAVRYVAKRIRSVQDFLESHLLLENVSAYVKSDSPMSEAEFLTAIAEEADCYLLVDVNNLYVNQVNLGLDAMQALQSIPLQRIREIHLAGYEDKGRFLIDAHNNPVSEPVWDLFAHLVTLAPDVPVCIEWDNNIPPLEVLLDEAARAASIVHQVRDAVA